MKKIYMTILLLLFCAVLISGCDMFSPPDPTGTSGWTVMNSGTGKDLIDISGNANNNIYAISADGQVQHYDGTNWSTFDTIQPDPGNTLTLNCIWVSSDGYVFVGGHEQGGPSNQGMFVYHNGVKWVDKLFMATDVMKIWGASPGHNDVYFACKSGKIARFTGTTWSYTTTTETNELRSIWGTDVANLYAGGVGGGILRYNSVGLSWASVNPSITVVTNPVVESIWGTTGKWLCTGPDFYGTSTDGTTWNFEEELNLDIKSMWGTSDGTLIFGVGSYSFSGTGIDHNILRFNSSESSWNFLTGFPPNNTIQLNAIWGREGAHINVYAVGAGGVILHYFQ